MASDRIEEAEGYAASLEQWADWIDHAAGRTPDPNVAHVEMQDIDTDELRAAATYVRSAALRADPAPVAPVRGDGGERPYYRVLPLGDDGQLDTPRRPEFWRAQAEFGVVEEWACWVMEGEINPLSDLSLAGLRGLVKEHGTMTARQAQEGSDLGTGSALEDPSLSAPDSQQTEGQGDA